MKTAITTASHPTSGETYAVKIVDGSIVEAAGPLHHSDPTDADALDGWLANHSDSAADDGAWLQMAIDDAAELDGCEDPDEARDREQERDMLDEDER